MENEIVVNEELTSPTPSEGETQEVVTTEEAPQPAPGSKTESELLLVSLHEEREKRRALEAEKLALEEKLKSSTLPEDEVFSDEGIALKRQIDELKIKLSSREEKESLQEVANKYPILKEKSEEFENFRKDYPGAKLESVAKLYLSENGLIESPRKGLEKPTGGTRTPLTSGMTADDVKTLRETNWKQYQEKLQNGQIKIES